jgi:DNA polymerase-3 subunit epsilon
MRQIVLDTETTGLEPELGHRIIEIGCVEIVNRRVTGRTFHRYLNPERAIDEGAMAVHGIKRADLDDKPKFAEVAEELITFISDAELVIHNAAFDVAFLDAELARLAGARRAVAPAGGFPAGDFPAGDSLADRSVSPAGGSFAGRSVSTLCRVLDSLALARSMHPGQRNNLDALCKRYEVDNSRRDLHGALLDAQILADVYLAMTGGQVGLALSETTAPVRAANDGQAIVPVLVRGATPLCVVMATEEEALAHESMLKIIAKASGGKCLWTPVLVPAVAPEQTLSSA